MPAAADPAAGARVPDRSPAAESPRQTVRTRARGVALRIRPAHQARFGGTVMEAILPGHRRITGTRPRMRPGTRHRWA
nr:hypothetical protein StreXyl84_11550 [Streptomyces sp. Xyl84]